MIKPLLFLLGLGLPLHGAITVFLPDVFRWWKEGVLLALGGILVWGLISKKCEVRSMKWRDFSFLSSHFLFVILFLSWLAVLMVVSADFVTAATATRYISLGFVVFLLILGLIWTDSAQNGEKVFHKFSTGLILGSLISTLFGVWAQFLGGFDRLTQWYSATISSWVPGQTLPLYHQTSEGVVRMQGMSSGPIEFSHLLILALWLLLSENFEVRSKKYGALIFHISYFILLLGILLSGSRAAMLGAVLVGLFYAGKYLQQKLLTSHFSLRIWDSHWAVNAVCLLVFAIAGLGGLKYVVLELPESHIQKVVRLSDSDHITRPIEAFKMGLENPILGNLGALGPAARAKNMATINSDQAPIAENVFVDYFAQLGILGLIFASFFWISWLWCHSHRGSYDWVLLGSVMLLMMNLATVLDMTPISIAWFATLAFAVTLHNCKGR